MFRGWNAIAQGVSENLDPDLTNSEIREWKFMKQTLKLKNVLTQQVVRLIEMDEDSWLPLMTIIFTPSHMVLAILEALCANKRRLPNAIQMHLDRLHVARTKHKGKMELAIPYMDCPDREINVEKRWATNTENCKVRLSVQSHIAYTGKLVGEARAYHIESMNCLNMRLPKQC